LGHESDRFARATRSCCSTYSMDIIFGVLRNIIVDDNVNRRDIESTI
jgi:hypothetical protein